MKTDINIGLKFNSLTIIKLVSDPDAFIKYYECACDCGKIVTENIYNLKTNRIRSCGCLRNPIIKADNEEPETKEFKEPEIKEFKVNPIEQSVLQVCRVTMDELRSKSRKQEIKEARQIGMFFNWAIKDKSVTTLKQIGSIYNKDHSSVLASVKRVKVLYSRMNHCPFKSNAFRSNVEKVAMLTGINFKHLI